MYKVFLFLHLCVCAINCDTFQCDIKQVKDTERNGIHNKTTFCKEHTCIFRRCLKPNQMIVVQTLPTKKIKRFCGGMEWIKKKYNISLDIPVFNSGTLKRSNKTLNDFSFVTVPNKNVSVLTQEKCLEVEDSVIESGKYGFLEDGSVLMGKLKFLSQEFIAEFRIIVTADKIIGPQIVIRSFNKINKIKDNRQDIYEAIGLLISSVFLILVLVVYSMFKKLRERYYSKLLMSYIACFTVMYVVMAALRLGSDARVFGNYGCRFITMTMYFSTMATFFWLNVMSYEIWNTFRPKNNFRSSQSRQGNRKFLLTTLYAFGVPLAMLAVVVVIDELKLTAIRPAFKKCMHSNKAVLFHYVPITIIICVNTVFFVMTSYHLWQQKKGRSLDSKETRIYRQNQNYFGLYLKLSVSTGVTWIVDVIGVYTTLPRFIVYFLAAFFYLLGVIVFIVCVCNGSVLKLLRKRFSINNRFMNQTSVSTATQDSKKTRSTKRTESNL